MASIEKRVSNDGSVTYRVKVRLKGAPTRSATFARRTDAKKWVQQTESAIREGRYFKGAESKKHTLSEAIDRYIKYELPKKPKSYPVQLAQLKWWRQDLGRYTLADITSAKVVEARDKLQSGLIGKDKRRSPATVNRYLAILSHLFTVAINEWEWTEENPFKKVSKLRESRGRVRFLSDEERKNLLSACLESKNPYLHPIVVLAISTGMRKGEILNLTWKSVDLKRKIITLEDTKNGERRGVPLVGLARDLIKQIKKSSSSELIFPGQKPQKPISIKTAWKTALRKAEIGDFRFHDLRHSAASYLAMNGASAAEIAEVLGHKTLQMVKRYAHLSEGHKITVVKRMNERVFNEL